MAARYGLVLARLMMTSLGPDCGPMARAKRVMLSTGREPWPATVEPNQSTSRSSVLWTTEAGMSVKRKLAAKAASWAPGVVMWGSF